MTYKERAQVGCDLFAEAMDLDYGVKEVTTDRQGKNGTRMFQIPTGERFGVYKSGMVRKIIRTKLLKQYSCYQLNRQYQQNSKAMFLNNDGTFNTRSYTGTARTPIYTELARLNYLLDYVKKNYNVRDKGAQFIIVNGVKYIRDDKY